MRTKLFLLLGLAAAAGPLACGADGRRPAVEAPPVIELEQPEPEYLPSSASTWPDAVDLGVVVHSGITPSENLPPPPDLLR